MNFVEAKSEMKQLLNNVNPSELPKLLNWIKNSGKHTCSITDSRTQKIWHARVKPLTAQRGWTADWTCSGPSDTFLQQTTKTSFIRKLQEPKTFYALCFVWTSKPIRCSLLPAVLLLLLMGFMAVATNVKVHYRHLLCWSVNQSYLFPQIRLMKNNNNN